MNYPPELAEFLEPHATSWVHAAELVAECDRAPRAFARRRSRLIVKRMRYMVNNHNPRFRGPGRRRERRALKPGGQWKNWRFR